jgi:protein O-mannosyl-transferase
LPAAATQIRKSDTPSGEGGLFSSPEKRTVVLSLLLLVVTLVAYNPVSHNGFINFDDNVYITHNAHVQDGLTWGTITWAFSSYDQANWHPITWLSHALDWQLFGKNPAGHHYVNVLLHAACVILLFLLLQQATGFTWRSLVVAALFALHPVNVESVAWAAERKNTLSMLFFLLALGAYTKYARKPGLGRYVAVAVFFALGLMSKPQIIAFPFVLLLWDYWPLRRTTLQTSAAGTQVPASSPLSFLSLVIEKIPLFALAAASAAITISAQHTGHAVRTIEEYSLSDRLSNAVFSYARYLENMVWPVHLAAMYPHPGSSLSARTIVFSALVLVTITALVILNFRRGFLPVGWLWFLGTMVPMIGIVQVGEQGMADRYAYLPYIGLFILAVWEVAEWCAKLRIPHLWPGLAAGCVLLTLGVLTYHQLGYWRDSETLWRYTLSVTHNNYMAEDNLARALADEGRIDEAVSHFEAAVKLHAYEPNQLLQLGFFEQDHGYSQDALAHYRRVLDTSSDPKMKAAALVDLGAAYLQSANLAQARRNYEAAVQLQPDQTAALLGLGIVAQRSGNLAEAVAHYNQATSLAPTDLGYLLLSRALEQQGRHAESSQAYQTAERLSTDFNQTRQTADHLLAQPSR